MPFQDVGNIEEAYTRSRPVYKGQHPLKASDIQLVLDSHGRPDAPIQHPAFDPIVEQFNFSTPSDSLPNEANEDILKKFPAPPANNNSPRRPKVAAPPLGLYDDLLPPNPAFAREQIFSATRPGVHREPYRQLFERSQSSSSRYHDDVQPQALPELGFLCNDPHEDGTPTIMKHPNISTKSLGSNVRLRDGPARRVVINGPARYDSRPRMHSGASSRSIMSPNTTQPSSGRCYMEPRQRQTSNASTTPRHAEFGYISHTDSHYHTRTNTPSRSTRPLQPSYRP